MKKLFLSIIITLTFFLGFASPAYADTCDDLKKQFEDAAAGDLAEKFPQYCTEGSVYSKVTTFLYYMVGIVAVLAFMYGGYLYMLSGGDETQTKKGKEVLKWAVIGVIVVLAAALIVNVVIRALVDNQIF